MEDDVNTLLKKIKLVVVLSILVNLPTLIMASTAVYNPQYGEGVLLQEELRLTGAAYQESASKLDSSTSIIYSLDDIPEGTDTLYVIAHGNSRGIMGWNDETGEAEKYTWCAVVRKASEAGVTTLIIDACSSGSAIEAAKHVKLNSAITIYTSSDAGEPSTAQSGEISLFSQLWTEADGEYTASYDSYGRTVNPQYEVVEPRNAQKNKKLA